jgi:NAD(P)-dependent dehydrogenase (short-subunit alcohol dehydrogenase family)
MSKVWLITGASRGLGRAFTEEILKAGDRVVAAPRKYSAGNPMLLEPGPGSILNIYRYQGTLGPRWATWLECGNPRFHRSD